MRQEGIPVGLKNVGNTCYFNSFIQAFFFLPNMTDKLLLRSLSAPVQLNADATEEKRKRVGASR